MLCMNFALYKCWHNNNNNNNNWVCRFLYWLKQFTQHFACYITTLIEKYPTFHMSVLYIERVLKIGGCRK